jgi:nucleoside-triphosphatase THEP1
MTIITTLNEGQQAAADSFFTFLFSTDPEFIISGPGGVGKTHLMSHMIDKIMPQYFQTCQMMNIKPEYDEVVMTATTNKAAEVLAVATGRPTSTIHSFMNLKVQDNYVTGEQKIAPTNNYHVHEKKIIFIDECSMIDSQLYKYLREGTHQCKLIYVGDHCQLAPVMEKFSPVYKEEKPFFVLTEQMRNANQPALMAVCDQLRETVKTGIFKPIQIVPGVIDLLDNNQMQEQIAAHFMQQTYDSRILAYTNNQVMAYNDYIRSLRNLPREFTVGERLINNSAIQLRRRMLSVEEEVTVEWVSPEITDVPIDEGAVLQVRYMNLESRVGELLENIPVPVDRDHHKALLKYFQKKGKESKYWAPYFQLKNDYPDLRQRDAATFHKAQGSTYDSVFIDLDDLSSCRQADQAARMLYVALSRARTRVFLYGNLAPKYGGLIQ